MVPLNLGSGRGRTVGPGIFSVELVEFEPPFAPIPCLLAYPAFEFPTGSAQLTFGSGLCLRSTFAALPRMYWDQTHRALRELYGQSSERVTVTSDREHRREHVKVP